MIIRMETPELALSGDDAVRWVNDTVGGFATALCAMKALLEYDIELGAVSDHHPA